MVQNSQTVGQHLKFLSLRKPFMLGKTGIKVFDHIFPQTLTLTLLGEFIRENVVESLYTVFG
jgi:hypothetical protein